MSRERDDAAGSGAARRLGGPHQGAARAYQIVDDEGDGSLDVAHEQVAGDDAGAAMLVGERLADGPAGRSLECFTEQLRAFRAARVGRDDTELFVF